MLILGSGAGQETRALEMSKLTPHLIHRKDNMDSGKKIPRTSGGKMVIATAPAVLLLGPEQANRAEHYISKTSLILLNNGSSRAPAQPLISFLPRQQWAAQSSSLVLTPNFGFQPETLPRKSNQREDQGDQEPFS
ncbi:hypothetical protein CRG98_006317 [Punica granatum]|uniref:Uncharacterized protein n=1 Tax=Punica granatum TaxID=22663 RepID=A0A2I0KY34_PUNGR|nr:hypothetical protein CRG98_006317 [Punica granatum]